MQITVCGEVLKLLPGRAIYWAARKTLWVADPHFGKATHFNKTGVWVPPKVTDADLFALTTYLADYDVERLVFLGDLFHSTYNSEWEKFGQWLSEQDCEVHLIKGNHDILKPEFYTKYNLQVHNEFMIDMPFVYLHHYDKPNEAFGSLYPVSGHVHPAYVLTGKGRQAVRVPCFYFGVSHAILPAFGRFTGMFSIEKQHRDDNFYVIAGTEILKV